MTAARTEVTLPRAREVVRGLVNPSFVRFDGHHVPRRARQNGLQVASKEIDVSDKVLAAT